MKAKFLLWIPMALWALPALADDMVAVRPGLICISAKALALLTLPDGSSRTQPPNVERLGDSSLAKEGGCYLIRKGMHAHILQAYRNTSIALVDVGEGQPRRFTIPNIDFEPAIVSPGPQAAGSQSVQAGSPGASELPQQAVGTPILARSSSSSQEDVFDAPLATSVVTGFAWHKLQGDEPDYDL